MMEKFEYKCTVEDNLNDYAKKGWRVIQIIPENERESARFLMERRIQ